MKKRNRELAKPGIYGSVDNPQIVTENDLREIAETFPEIKKAPISLNGHWPDPARPRLGNVISVTFNEASKVLSGEIEEHDTLASAVDEGFYPDLSIGGKRRAVDGKMYLHHVAYLGEEPPAIKDLIKEIQGELNPPAGQIAASDRSGVILFPPSTAARLQLSDPAATNPESGVATGAPNTPKEVPPMDELEQAKADLVAEKKKSSDLTAEVEKFKAQLGELAKKYPEEGIALSDADPRVSELMGQLRAGKKAELLKATSGRIPKGKQPLVIALADSMGVSQSIELSDGTTKSSVSQIELLTSIFDALPPMVRSGALDLGDGETPPMKIDTKGLMACV